MDATLITAASAKQRGGDLLAGLWVPSAGHLGANTGEALATWLRPVNSGSNTASDRIGALAIASAPDPRGAQVP